MITEVYKNIYLISVPLPDTPLKQVNSYFIRGNERNLMVDVAFNAPICREAYENAMETLGFTFENTDIFITHAHADHCGLAGTYCGDTNWVYCTDYVVPCITQNDDMAWDYYDGFIIQSGLTDTSRDSHVGDIYASDYTKNIKIVKDGDVVSVGDYNLHCIRTPGHSPEHLCLYEPEHKILFSADHIIDVITPNNTVWKEPWQSTQDLLGDYLVHLEKIKDYDIELTLPGHRNVITDVYKRIDELLEHHRIRLDAIITILKESDKKMNGAEIASKMQWRIRARNWEEFPYAQKIFATGEAMSHLVHLTITEKVNAELIDGVIYYTAN